MKLSLFIMAMTFTFKSYAADIVLSPNSGYSLMGKCAAFPSIVQGEGFIYFFGQRNQSNKSVNINTVRVVSEIAVEDEELSDAHAGPHPNFSETSDFASLPALVTLNGGYAKWTHPVRGVESSGQLNLDSQNPSLVITNSTWSKILPSYAFCAFGL